MFYVVLCFTCPPEISGQATSCGQIQKYHSQSYVGQRYFWGPAALCSQIAELQGVSSSLSEMVDLWGEEE
jgi:hypothetical protein